jgi:DnaJ-class molecular chaperone
MRDGQEVPFARASEQAPDTVPGDVIVTLRTQPHARFVRKGNDLHMEQRISLREALLGYSSSFAHMDGHRVVVSTENAVTPPEHVKIIKGEGMPVHEFASEKGDLHVLFHIDFPAQLNKDQQNAIKTLFV